MSGSREVIEAELLNGTMAKELSERFGIARASLSRHRLVHMGLPSATMRDRPPSNGQESAAHTPGATDGAHVLHSATVAADNSGSHGATPPPASPPGGNGDDDPDAFELPELPANLIGTMSPPWLPPMRQPVAAVEAFSTQWGENRIPVREGEVFGVDEAGKVALLRRDGCKFRPLSVDEKRCHGWDQAAQARAQAEQARLTPAPIGPSPLPPKPSAMTVAQGQDLVLRRPFAFEEVQHQRKLIVDAASQRGMPASALAVFEAEARREFAEAQGAAAQLVALNNAARKLHDAIEDGSIERMKREAELARAHARAAQVAILNPAFNPQALLATLYGRGVILAVKDGTIHSRGMLGDADKQLIAQHKAEIIKALTDFVPVA
jgi:hypothetical protein